MSRCWPERPKTKNLAPKLKPSMARNELAVDKSGDQHDWPMTCAPLDLLACLSIIPRFGTNYEARSGRQARMG